MVYKNKALKKATEKKWIAKNKRKVNRINKRYYDRYPNKRKEANIRRGTRQKYGKLKKGFIYHHNTKPYKKDKFVVLEKDFHNFYHRNKKKFNIKGRL